MNKFGVIKSKLLNKLTESYTKENKTEFKSILKEINENKDFKEMYLFYEEIENMELNYPGSAQLYVETVEPLLVEKTKSIENFCNKLSKFIGDVDYEKNELYECLDELSEKSNLTNIDRKVIAKKKLIDHLSTKKEVKTIEESVYVPNENLLHAVLTNNFNTLYNNSLNEDEKNEFKDILLLTNEDIENKIKELKESVLKQVETLLNESKDNDFINKLKDVKDEVQKMNSSKYNYYKLTELKNGLN